MKLKYVQWKKQAEEQVKVVMIKMAHDKMLYQIITIQREITQETTTHNLYGFPTNHHTCVYKKISLFDKYTDTFPITNIFNISILMP